MVVLFQSGLNLHKCIIQKAKNYTSYFGECD